MEIALGIIGCLLLIVTVVTGYVISRLEKRIELLDVNVHNLHREQELQRSEVRRLQERRNGKLTMWDQ